MSCFKKWENKVFNKFDLQETINQRRIKIVVNKLNCKLEDCYFKISYGNQGYVSDCSNDSKWEKIYDL